GTRKAENDEGGQDNLLHGSSAPCWGEKRRPVSRPPTNRSPAAREQTMLAQYGPGRSAPGPAWIVIGAISGQAKTAGFRRCSRRKAGAAPCRRADHLPYPFTIAAGWVQISGKKAMI